MLSMLGWQTPLQSFGRKTQSKGRQVQSIPQQAYVPRAVTVHTLASSNPANYAYSVSNSYLYGSKPVVQPQPQRHPSYGPAGQPVLVPSRPPNPTPAPQVAVAPSRTPAPSRYSTPTTPASLHHATPSGRQTPSRHLGSAEPNRAFRILPSARPDSFVYERSEDARSETLTSYSSSAETMSLNSMNTATSSTISHFDPHGRERQRSSMLLIKDVGTGYDAGSDMSSSPESPPHMTIDLPVSSSGDISQDERRSRSSSPHPGSSSSFPSSAQATPGNLVRTPSRRDSSPSDSDRAPATTPIVSRKLVRTPSRRESSASESDDTGMRSNRLVRPGFSAPPHASTNRPGSVRFPSSSSSVTRSRADGYSSEDSRPGSSRALIPYGGSLRREDSRPISNAPAPAIRSRRYSGAAPPPPHHDSAPHGGLADDMHRIASDIVGSREVPVSPPAFSPARDDVNARADYPLPQRERKLSGAGTNTAGLSDRPDVHRGESSQSSVYFPRRDSSSSSGSSSRMRSSPTSLLMDEGVTRDRTYAASAVMSAPPLSLEHSLAEEDDVVGDLNCGRTQRIVIGNISVEAPMQGRNVRFSENLICPSPIPPSRRRKGWFNKRGDQLWTNDGQFVPPDGHEYPPDLDDYPDYGVGWMNEEGIRIDMQHRLIPKAPLRPALKRSSTSSSSGSGSTGSLSRSGTLIRSDSRASQIYSSSIIRPVED